MTSFSTNGNAAASPPRSLKSRLERGETLYGIVLFTLSPNVAEIVGLAGYDYVVVDMEHGSGFISDALPCLRALAATGTPAVVRVPKTDAMWAKKVLDLGPQGIMFPMIEDAKMAGAAVSYCRFPPRGVRGSAPTFVRASGYGTDANYLRDCENDLLVMCQVETAEAIKNIEEIAAVEGVDCVQMGPRDLCASLGYIRDPGHPKVKEVMHGAEKMVLKVGAAYLSGSVMPHDHVLGMRRRGYHMMSVADVGLIRDGAIEDVRRFKMSNTPAVVENDVKRFKKNNTDAVAAVVEEHFSRPKMNNVELQSGMLGSSRL